MTLAIQALTWDRHTFVTGLNRMVWSQANTNNISVMSVVLVVSVVLVGETGRHHYKSFNFITFTA